MSGDPAAAPILTDNVISGLSSGKILPSEVGATIPGVTEGKKAQFIYELCDAIFQGKLDKDTFDVAMQAAGMTPSDSPSDVLANTLWLLTLPLGDVPETDARLQRLVELVDVVKQKKWVYKQLLLETQEAVLLQACGLGLPATSGDKQPLSFAAREKRYMTNMLFKQTKYNAFREDNEGYAKLVALLGSTHLGPDTFEALVTELKALVGTFELDPNRVAAVVLVAWQEDPHNTAYLDLLPLFNAELPLQAMGFKLINDSRADASSKASPGFYIVAAQLIRAGIITLEQLLPYMGTTMDMLSQQAADTVEAALVHAGVKAAAAVQEPVQKPSQAAGGDGGAAGKRKIKFQASSLPSQAASEGLQSFGPQPLDLSVVEYMGPWADPYAPLLGLLRGLLEVQGREHALLLLKWLELRGVHPMHDAGVRGVLTRQLRAALAPLTAGLDTSELRGSDGKGGRGNSKGKYLHLPEEVYSCVELLGVYVCANPEVLQLLLMVLGRHLEDATKAGPGVHEDKMAKLEPLLGRAILPGLCLAPGLIPTCLRAWELLRGLPYQRRFLLYATTWEVQREAPICVLAVHKAVEEVKRINRRSVASADRVGKEVGRANARRYQRIMTGLPLGALNEVISWAITATHQVEVTSEGIRYIPDMALDALTFLLLHNLGSLKRGKVKDDGINVAAWLAKLAAFLAAVYKRLPEDVDVLAVASYLVRQLRAANSLDVVVLQELLEGGCGITLTTAVDKDKRPYLACSALMRHLRCSQGFNCCDDAAVDCMRALVGQVQVKAPPGEALGLPLFVLLGQQLRYALYASRTEVLGLVQDLHHRVHSTLLEWKELLHMGLTKDQLAALIPTPAQLVEGYGVPLEFAMSLWRPLLGALLPSYGTEDGEEGEVPESGEGAGGASELLASLATYPRVAGLTLATFKGGLEGLGAHASYRGVFGRDELFLAFWGLDLQDLVFERRLYDQVLAEQQGAVAALEIPYTNRRTALDRTVASCKQELRRVTEAAEQGMRYGGGYHRAPMPGQMAPYMAEQAKLAAHKRLEAAKDAARRHAEEGARELRRACSSSQERIQVLRSDIKEHERRHRATRARLAAEKDVFIALAPPATTPASARASSETPAAAAAGQAPEGAAAGSSRGPQAEAGFGKVVNVVLSTCVMPRALMSLEDALFCHQFGWALYELNTPGWSSITYWDKLVKQLVQRIPTATGEEAGCLSLLLEETMGVLERWRRDKEEYGKQLAVNQTLVIKGMPDPAVSKASASSKAAAKTSTTTGGVTSTATASAAAAGAAAAATAAGGGGSNSGAGGLLRPATAGVCPAPWSFLAKLCNKMHDNLTSTFLAALSSGDRMQQRTAVGIMSSLVEVYPLITDHHREVLGSLEAIRDSLPRQDAMATSTTSLITKLRSNACTERLMSKFAFKGLPEPKSRAQPPQQSLVRKQPAGSAPADERPPKKLRVEAPEFKPTVSQPKTKEGGSTAAAAGGGRGREAIKPPPAGGSRAPSGNDRNAATQKQQPPSQQQRREEAVAGSRAGGTGGAAGDRDRDGKRKPAPREAAAAAAAAAGDGSGGSKRARVEQAGSDMEPGELPAPGGGRPAKAPGGMAAAALANAGLIKGKDGSDHHPQQQQQPKQEPKQEGHRSDTQRKPQPPQQQQDKAGKDREQRGKDRDSSRPRGPKDSKQVKEEREEEKDRGDKEAAGPKGGSSKPPTSPPAAAGADGGASKQQQPESSQERSRRRGRDKPPQQTKGDPASDAGDAGDAKAAAEPRSKPHRERRSSRGRGGGGSDAEGGLAQSADAAGTPASSAGDGKGEQRRRERHREKEHRDREHRDRHKDKGEGSDAAAAAAGAGGGSREKAMRGGGSKEAAPSPAGADGGSTAARGGGDTPEPPAKGGEGRSSHHHKDKERDREKHRDKEHHKERDRGKEKEKGREHKGSGSGRQAHGEQPEGGSRPVSPDKREGHQQPPEQQQPSDKEQERPRQRDKEGSRRGDKADAAGDTKPPRHRSSGGDKGGAAAEGDSAPAASKGDGKEAGHKRVRDRSSDRQQAANGAAPSPTADSKPGRSEPAAAGGDAASPRKASGERERGDGKPGCSSSRRDKGGSSHRDKEAGEDGKGANRRAEAPPDTKRRKVEPAAEATSQPDTDTTRPSRSSRPAGDGGPPAAVQPIVVREGSGGGGRGGGADGNDGAGAQQQAAAPSRRRHAPILPPSPLPGPPADGGGPVARSAPKRTSR